MANLDLSFVPKSATMDAGNPAATIAGNTNLGLSAIAGAGAQDFFSSPAYQSILSLLGPGAGGGLSPALMAMYGQGKSMNDLNTSANASAAMSDAAGRGLSGSTIESQGVQNARFTGAMADSSLLSSLYGLQNTNQGQLAGMTMQGQSMNQDTINQRLMMMLQLLSGSSSDMANYGMFQQSEADMANAASAANKSALWGSLLQGGGSALGAYLGKK